MQQRQYESIIIITPLLTDEQMKEVASNYEEVLKKHGAELVHQENWGLRKLAYSIDKKSTGFYHLYEFKGDPEVVSKLEVELKRDDRILRFLTVSLDKYGVEYNDRRKKGEVGKRPGQSKKQENVKS